MSLNQKLNKVNLVVLDLAGTIVDYGSCAPAGTFISLFKKYDINVTSQQARQPMGLDKKSHIKTLLQMPEINEQWVYKHQNNWDDADLDIMYQEFILMQLEQLPLHSKIISGTLEVIEYLRCRQIKIAVTTGYNRQMMQVVLDHLKQQGFEPDFAVCSEDVESGRPQPDMLHKCMEYFGVEDKRSVIKAGDTIADIQAGINAGVWTVGVVKHGNCVGLSAEQINSLNDDELKKLIDQARQQLFAAQANYVIETIAELKNVVDKIDSL